LHFIKHTYEWTFQSNWQTWPSQLLELSIKVAGEKVEEGTISKTIEITDVAMTVGTTIEEAVAAATVTVMADTVRNHTVTPPEITGSK